MFDILDSMITDAMEFHVLRPVQNDCQILNIFPPKMEIGFNLYRNQKIIKIIFKSNVDANLYALSGKYTKDQLQSRAGKILHFDNVKVEFLFAA